MGKNIMFGVQFEQHTLQEEVVETAKYKVGACSCSRSYWK